MTCGESKCCSAPGAACAGSLLEALPTAAGDGDGVVTKEEFDAVLHSLGTFLYNRFRTSDGRVNLKEATQFLTAAADAGASGPVSPSAAARRPYGLPVKDGVTTIASEDWCAIESFIESGVWHHSTPVDDGGDPVVAGDPGYGAFMLGFDFHMTPAGPRLIEVNTNAGGLATVFHVAGCAAEREMIIGSFVQAVREEWRLFCAGRPAGQDSAPLPEVPNVAIVDDDAIHQGLYAEMLLFADVLSREGVPAVVAAPDDLRFDAASGCLVTADADARVIHFVYNRIAPDFKLTAPAHAHLRAALAAGSTAVSPHPAAYARIADKRLLQRLAAAGHAVVPATMSLGDRPIDEWVADKKRWVFKPPEGNASRGVYRGDKVSNAVLRGLPANTIAQEMCPPGADPADRTKYDVRVFTHGRKVLALASRHFSGQVMEMRSAQSGFRHALPDGVCCLPMLPLRAPSPAQDEDTTEEGV